MYIISEHLHYSGSHEATPSTVNAVHKYIHAHARSMAIYIMPLMVLTHHNVPIIFFH